MKLVLFQSEAQIQIKETKAIDKQENYFSDFGCQQEMQLPIKTTQNKYPPDQQIPNNICFNEQNSLRNPVN